MAKAKTRNIFRIVVSIIFILLGVYSVFTVFDATIGAVQSLIGGSLGGLAALAGTLFTCAVGILEFIAGVMGILKTKGGTCRVLGFIILIIAIVSFVIAGFPFTNILMILNIVLPILYIIGVGK